MRRYLVAAFSLSGLAVGCAMPVDDVAGATANGALVDTYYCEVQGLGTLEPGELLAGSTSSSLELGVEGSWVLVTPPVADPNCVPDDDDDGCGGRDDWEGWDDDQKGGDHGGHPGHSRGRGHFEHGRGHGYGHDHHDHEDPCAPKSDTIVLTPEVLHCRVNGVTLAFMDGTATVNGEGGYLFSFAGQEFEDPIADYVTIRIWAPNPAYVVGGAEPEYVLFYEVSAELVDGSFDVSLP